MNDQNTIDNGSQDAGDKSENNLPASGNIQAPETDNAQPEKNPESAIINPQSETKNMEVHHHSHHDHGKKTWKKYFWEFFMLFLAVFCGSVAELQLEHYIEHRREKGYIKSLADDLRTDIRVVDRAITNARFVAKGKDSLVQLINRGITTSRQVDTFYALHKLYVGINRQSLFSKATITQLLNAGYLRLIQKRNVADSITLYASRIDYFEKQLLPQFIHYNEKTLDASEGLIDTKYFLSSLESEKYQPTTTNVLASNDPRLLKNFAFRLEIDKEGDMVTITTLKRIGTRAERLLALLEKEYDLK